METAMQVALRNAVLKKLILEQAADMHGSAEDIKPTLMDALHMERIESIDAMTPEAYYLATHKAMDDAVTLVASQLSVTRQAETRSLMESGEFRTGIPKSAREPGKCVIIKPEKPAMVALTFEERINLIYQQLGA